MTFIVSPALDYRLLMDRTGGNDSLYCDIIVVDVDVVVVVVVPALETGSNW